MKRFVQWMIAAILISGSTLFTSCGKDDNSGTPDTGEKALQFQWIADYAEVVTAEVDIPHTRVVKVYEFFDDGTGYFEHYLLNGDELKYAKYARGENGDFTYTVVGNQVTVSVADFYGEQKTSWTLSFANNKMSDPDGREFRHTTEAEREQILKRYEEWHGGSSEEVDREMYYVHRSWDGSKVTQKYEVVRAKSLISISNYDGDPVNLSSGAYYVKGCYELYSCYKINSGNQVDIILCDDCELTVWRFSVEGEGSRLRIFGQEEDSGYLYVDGQVGDFPAIGCEKNGGCDIEFHGGCVEAEGPAGAGCGGAGIGGAYKPFNSITIYGGEVYAYAGNDCPGIGNGQECSVGYGHITIYGGTVWAQGGEYAAGIGGGDNNRVASINIHGGSVNAYSGVDGAGIGGGEDGDSGDILITGGTVRDYGDRFCNNVSHKGYGAGIGSGQDGSVSNITITGGDVEAYGGEDAAGIGTGEEFERSDLSSGNIIISGGKVFAQGKGYGAGIGAGEDATFGLLSIAGGRVDAHAGSACGPWSGGIGAYHKKHDDGCHIGWAGWERIYIGKGMRLWTYSPNVGGVENVTKASNWWDFVHQRPQVAFGVCDHSGYTEATCPFCYRETLQLR
ncbi:MAG: lipocalin family protein [Prevotella sp.]|nr:lipocalin family protein [Prevotella sp.]